MVLNSDPTVGAAMFFQNAPQFHARGCIFLIDPDPNVIDNRRLPGLDAVRSACEQCQPILQAEIHGLKHGVAAGVVSGQVEHAFLPEEDQSIQLCLSHGLPRPIDASIKFLLWEMKHLRSKAI